jgi:hypothetical protein
MFDAKHMKERPIIFDNESVISILKGSKTQTRRVIHPQMSLMADWQHVRCPYGVAGDHLWVRETFMLEKWTRECGVPPPIPRDRPSKLVDDDEGYYWLWPHYAATDPKPELICEGGRSKGGFNCRWKASIYMPLWASRITLEILRVGAERLCEITEKDALAEGCQIMEGYTPDGEVGIANARYSYKQRWDSINAKRGFGWDANPWVWVIEFKRLEDK